MARNTAQEEKRIRAAAARMPEMRNLRQSPPDSINNPQMQDEIVNRRVMAFFAVGSNQIGDGALVDRHYPDRQIPRRALVEGIISSFELASSQIIERHHGDQQVSRRALVLDAVDGSRLALGAVNTKGKLAADVVGIGAIDFAELFPTLDARYQRL